MFKPQLSKVHGSKSRLETQKVTETTTDGWGILRDDHLEAFFFWPTKTKICWSKGIWLRSPVWGFFWVPAARNDDGTPNKDDCVLFGFTSQSLNHKNICRLGPAQILQQWLMKVHKSPKHQMLKNIITANQVEWQPPESLELIHHNTSPPKSSPKKKANNLSRDTSNTNTPQPYKMRSYLLFMEL